MVASSSDTLKRQERYQECHLFVSEILGNAPGCILTHILTQRDGYSTRMNQNWYPGAAFVLLVWTAILVTLMFFHGVTIAH